MSNITEQLSALIDVAHAAMCLTVMGKATAYMGPNSQNVDCVGVGHVGWDQLQDALRRLGNPE